MVKYALVTWKSVHFKESTQFIFLCDSQKSWVNFFLIKNVKKKVILYFYNLGEENF